MAAVTLWSNQTNTFTNTNPHWGLCLWSRPLLGNHTVDA